MVLPQFSGFFRPRQGGEGCEAGRPLGLNAFPVRCRTAFAQFATSDIFGRDGSLKASYNGQLCLASP